MSEPTLWNAKQELLAQKELPEGYSIQIDRDTGNILVCGPTRLFCVTKEAIAANLHKSQYLPALNTLIEIENGRPG